MNSVLSTNPADYIVPLNINKLEGRMMRVPNRSKNNRNILLVYGHHAKLERWWSLVDNLAEYGEVTMPDLPGFGGMDNFYTIGKKPTIDNFADYLAAFINLRYKRRRLTIIGISFGFVVITRMLELYPEISYKIDLLVSEVGFMHKDDFLYSPLRRNSYRVITRFFAIRPVSFIIRYCFLNKLVLNFLYASLPQSKLRLNEVPKEEFAKTVKFEIDLWKENDVRTHWMTTAEFLNLDNCQKQINLPIIHVVSKADHYFDNEVVKQHMLIVYNSYKRFTANSKAHTPSVLADKKEASVMIPTGLKRLLKESV